MFRKQDKLKALLRPVRGRICFITAVTVLQALLQVSMALLTRNVIDAALAADQNLWLWSVLLILNVLTLVGGHSLHGWQVSSTVDKLAAKLRGKILRSSLFSRDETLLGHHSGELLSRGIEDVYTVSGGAVSLIPTLIGQVTRLVSAFAAILLIQPVAAAVLLLGALGMGIFVACIRPAIKKRQRLVRETDEQVLSAMQEDLQQLELIQGLEAQEQVLQCFQKHTQQNLLARFHRRIWAVGSSTLIHSASQVATAALLLWGAGSIAAGNLTYGALMALLQLLAQFRGPVMDISGLWAKVASVEIAAERLQEMLDDAEATLPEHQDLQVRQIVFENVSFAYPGEDTLVLENFSFRFQMDQWVCLTGVSGKGKTTMFKLMLGLYKPQKGRVYLQTDTGEVECSAKTRHLFAYVPQDYALLSGTILDNLQLVAPNVTQAQMREAFRVSQAEFVWRLTEQEMTQVRENNAGLSKGQLQRLAIARAVLMDRPIFLLDECTSALDAATEDGVLRGLKAGGKQAILVTHRPEALDVLGTLHRVSLEQL